MFSRRLLRIKVLQLFYAFLKSNNNSIAKAEKELFFSISKTYDLLFYLLLFLIDFISFAEERIEIAKNKKIPTYEDLNPNTRLIDNKVIKEILSSGSVNKYINNNKISWSNHPELIKKFYNIFITTDLYNNYINSNDKSFKIDQDFIYNFYNKAVLQYDDLHSVIEEESIYWNDDIEFIISIINKSIKYIDKKQGYKVMPMFKNSEDEEFTKNLFRKALVQYNEHKQLIDKYAKNWDVERIAFMDILIISLALTEIREFSSIPVKVSFNEYLEISKTYSTKNSSSFINGILDKIVKKWKEEKVFTKMGRGLIGDI